MRVSSSFDTTNSTQQYRANGSGQFGNNGRGTQVRIAFDALSGSYTVSDNRNYTTGLIDGSSYTDAGTTATFDRKNRISTNNYYDVYRKETGTSTDELTLYGNFRGKSQLFAPPIKLTYTSFGYWTHTDSATTETRKTYLLFGTPTSTLPVSGSANYKTLLVADSLYVSGTTSPTIIRSAINGTASFNVDFGTGSVATTLDLSFPGDIGQIGTFNGTGTVIAASQFQGTFASSATHYSNGAFAGGFFGPAAQEMGYSFHLYFHDDGKGGASIRPVSSTYINGVVVGTK